MMHHDKRNLTVSGVDSIRKNLRIFFLAALAGLTSSCGSGEITTQNTAISNVNELGPATQYSSNNIRLTKTVIGDLNGDGLNDVATLRSDGFDRFVYIYFQNEAGKLEAPKATFFNDILTDDIAIGDLNSDGKDDLVISAISTNTTVGWQGRVMVLYQDTTGNLKAPQAVEVSSLHIDNLAIGDMNSDGRNDIAVIRDEGLSLFYQNADGTLGPENFFITPVMRGDIYVKDMNNDGINDLVFQTAYLQFAVVKQDKLQAGVLNPPEYYDVISSYWPKFDSFTVGDVNGDHKNDVVTVDPGNNSYINVFLQNSSGRLASPVLVTVANPPFGLEIADINGDGLNDIVGDRVDPGFPAQGNILVWYQSATHAFDDYVAYRFTTSSGGGSAYFQNLSIGDVTGDGGPDAVVTWMSDGLFVLPHK